MSARICKPTVTLHYGPVIDKDLHACYRILMAAAFILGAVAGWILSRAL